MEKIIKPVGLCPRCSIPVTRMLLVDLTNGVKIYGCSCSECGIEWEEFFKNQPVYIGYRIGEKDYINTDVTPRTELPLPDVSFN